MKVNNRKHTAIVYALSMVGVAGFYCYLIVKEKVEPTLITWSTFFVATSLGLWTYLHAKKSKRDLLSNIINTADIIFVGAILVFIIFFGPPSRFGLSKFDLVCGAMVSFVALLYIFSKNADVANVTLNLIMVLGYIPLWANLIKTEHHTESLLFWVLSFAAVSIGSFNAFSKEGDFLTKLYAARGLVCSGIVIGLILWIEYR